MPVKAKKPKKCSMPNSTLHAKSKIALVEAEWAHFTTARSEHAARRVMAAHLLLRYALIVCLFFVPVKGTAALFAYAQKSGMQRQPVCAIQRGRAANCSSMCRHWSGFDRRNCNWWYRREWHRLTMPFPCDWITALFFFGKLPYFIFPSQINQQEQKTYLKDYSNDFRRKGNLAHDFVIFFD